MTAAGTLRGRPPRRTQAERRAETREALLDAAMAQLLEAGLSGFTTTEVARRSGLSQGAVFKHFPTKAELLAAVAEHLFGELRVTFERSFRSLPPRARDVSAGLRVLWQQMLDPRLAAAFELYAAARTDRELRERLSPVVRAHVDRIEEMAITVLPDADPGLVREATSLAIAAIQGLVLNQLALPDPSQVDRLRERLEWLVPLTLGGSSATLRGDAVLSSAAVALHDSPRTISSKPRLNRRSTPRG